MWVNTTKIRYDVLTLFFGGKSHESSLLNYQAFLTLFGVPLILPLQSRTCRPQYPLPLPGDLTDRHITHCDRTAIVFLIKRSDGYRATTTIYAWYSLVVLFLPQFICFGAGRGIKRYYLWNGNGTAVQEQWQPRADRFHTTSTSRSHLTYHGWPCRGLTCILLDR